MPYRVEVDNKVCNMCRLQFHMTWTTFSLSWFLPAKVEIGLISGPIRETASSLGGFVWVYIRMRGWSLRRAWAITEWVWCDAVKATTSRKSQDMKRLAKKDKPIKTRQKRHACCLVCVPVDFPTPWTPSIDTMSFVSLREPVVLLPFVPLILIISYFTFTFAFAAPHSTNTEWTFFPPGWRPQR